MCLGHSANHMFPIVASKTKEVEKVVGALATKVLYVPAFWDFLEVFLDVEVLASPFLFLHNNNLLKPLCSHTENS